MTTEHKTYETWSEEEFPYDIEETETLTKILPEGFWFAIEISEGETFVRLMEFQG